MNQTQGIKSQSDYANALQKQAICYLLNNCIDDAIILHTQSLKIYHQLHGENHLDVANAMFNIAVCMNTQGAPGEAIKLLQKARDVMKKKLGEDCLDMVDILHQMGIAEKRKSGKNIRIQYFDNIIFKFIEISSL